MSTFSQCSVLQPVFYAGRSGSTYYSVRLFKSFLSGTYCCFYDYTYSNINFGKQGTFITSLLIFLQFLDKNGSPKRSKVEQKEKMREQWPHICEDHPLGDWGAVTPQVETLDHTLPLRQVSLTDDQVWPITRFFSVSFL